MHLDQEELSLAPTDLSNFLSCRHQSRLDLRVAQGTIERPVRYGPLLDELKARGKAHEAQYLEHLRRQGMRIALAGDSSDEQLSGTAVSRSLAAMREGVDVIYQATLADDKWTGRADFLCRVPSPSNLGSWSYQVIDTKLARDTRAGTLLQLCVYSYLLGKLQGKLPDRMSVVTPATDYQPIHYRLADYGAYFRLLERGIDRFVDKPPATYPERVEHCDFCAWWSDCEKRRRADDHLCYVAGISNSQIKSLAALGIERLADLARLDQVPKPSHGSQQALAKLKEQARVQWLGRERYISYHELKQPIDVGHGLSLLPEPTADDIFLDLEGNHFAEYGVKEYLIGYLYTGPDGQAIYTPLWAETLERERLAFERFIDVASAVRARNPAAHIYHFAPYEPAALKRLMGRYATREVELDSLLRGNALVDLLAVVRRSLIASVESYSIKDLEPFFGYTREQDLREAAASRRLIEHAIEAGELDTTFDSQRLAVERYNREDCESARRLRDWLEQLRAHAVTEGADLPRPELDSGEASPEIGELDSQLQRLRDGLLQTVPADPEQRSPQEQARFVLAHLMEFHRREDKASWWEYFRVRALEPSEYADERRAVTGLQFVEQVEAGNAPVHRYRFPSQELDARRADQLCNSDGDKFGTIAAVSFSERWIDIKKRMDTAQDHPHALLLHRQVSARALRESLMRQGAAVVAHGFSIEPPYRAASNLLLRRPPQLASGDDDFKKPGETTLAAACRLAISLDGGVLAIQGPPGAGKTYTAASVICALGRRKLKVGVTAVSHRVIVNLLEGVAREAQKQELALRIVHRQDGSYEGEWGIDRIKDYSTIRHGLSSGGIDVLGATAWCWARPDFAQSVDVLIVDEAGQMSLGNVLAAAPSAASLVLVGDPQQLEQPLQSSHPEGSEVSALAHFLGDAQTMPADRGLFLEQTYRLHPEIARFTSEIFYQGKLVARAELEHQAVIARAGQSLPLAGSGLRYVPVTHRGNRARSEEEVAIIDGIVTELLAQTNWRNADREVAPLGERDILIVAPYNAQVAALAEALPQLRDNIGTVDRFQGQEAAVVIYSMTSSSPEDVPRGMEFLYNPNRFNVATSRAQALCILVGSPALFEPACKTPRQMKMANVFCRYLELAQSP